MKNFQKAGKNTGVAWSANTKVFESCEKAQEILFNFEVPGDRDFKGREWQPGTRLLRERNRRDIPK